MTINCQLQRSITHHIKDSMKLALALTLGIIAAPCLAQTNGKV